MSSTDKVAEYFDAHGATEEEKEPMRDSTQKLKSYGIEKVSRGKWRHSNDVHKILGVVGTSPFVISRNLPSSICSWSLTVSTFLKTSPTVLRRKVE